MRAALYTRVAALRQKVTHLDINLLKMVNARVVNETYDDETETSESRDREETETLEWWFRDETETSMPPVQDETETRHSKQRLETFGWDVQAVTSHYGLGNFNCVMCSPMWDMTWRQQWRHTLSKQT